MACITAATSLASIPRKLHDGPDSFLSRADYPELVHLVDLMVAQDPKIVFDSLRPMGDEFWNLIDGKRTLGEIAEALCMQFDFDLEPSLFLTLAEGMARRGRLSLDA